MLKPFFRFPAAARPGLLLSLGLFLMLSGCASHKSNLKLGKSDAGEVVEAEGLAPYNASDILGSKKAALADAQKNSVEKVVGVYVSGKTMVEKAVAIENNILARTEGYIKKYDVISEGQDGPFYKVKIRALVAVKDLEADLKTYSLLGASEIRRPRLQVSLKEAIDKEPSDEGVCEKALRQSLIDQGFTLVGDTDAKNFDYEIRGKASSFPFQSEGLGGFVSFRARLAVDVRRPGSDEIVFSLTDEASGLGGNDTLAGFKSLETVGTKLGTDLGKKLTEIFSKGGNLLVMVEGVKSFSDVERIRKHLLAEPGVKDLVVRLYDENMAQFELQIGSMRPEELAARLEASKTFPLKVLEAKNQTIRLQYN